MSFFARRTAIFLLSFCVGLACATGGGRQADLSSLWRMDQIKTPDDAQRALITAQDFRVSVMRSVKKANDLGIKGAPTLEQFEAVDKFFRIGWDSANTARKEWSLTGNGQEAFKSFYMELLENSLKLERMRMASNGEPDRE
jgi:hypothetical protein